MFGRYYPAHIPRSKNRQVTFTRETDLAVLLNEDRSIEVLAKVRHCANTGFILLTESSREQLHRPHA